MISHVVKFAQLGFKMADPNAFDYQKDEHTDATNENGWPHR